MEDRQTLRQATKLWQEELDPEFGRSSKNIGAWLQEGKQARQCEPRAVPIHEVRADLPPRGALLGALREVGGSSAASSARRSRGQDASWPARSAELTESDAPNDDIIILHSSATSIRDVHPRLTLNAQRRAVPCPVACWPV